MASETGKHTPGPWKPNLPLRSDGRLLVAHVVTADGGGIAQLASLDGDATVEANARLIAAAPDMIAALQYVLACAERDGAASALAALNTVGRAAIAKAEGR